MKPKLKTVTYRQDPGGKKEACACPLELLKYLCELCPPCSTTLLYTRLLANLMPQDDHASAAVKYKPIYLSLNPIQAEGGYEP